MVLVEEKSILLKYEIKKPPICFSSLSHRESNPGVDVYLLINCFT
jgi:hypothetical protein